MLHASCCVRLYPQITFIIHASTTRLIHKGRERLGRDGAGSLPGGQRGGCHSKTASYRFTPHFTYNGPLGGTISGQRIITHAEAFNYMLLLIGLTLTAYKCDYDLNKGEVCFSFLRTSTDHKVFNSVNV